MWISCSSTIRIGSERLALRRAGGRAGPLSPLGHWIQSRPFHSFGPRSDQPGEHRHAHKNRDAGVASSGRRSAFARLFRKQFRAKVRAGREREYIELRMQDQAARHAKFGNSVYMQEPNVKSGCGGLRDYQNLLWMTFFKEGALTTTHLVGKDWLSEADRKRIEAAYDFLLRLRTDLHYATGRATDTLHLNVQEQIAKRLGYAPKAGHAAERGLMKDYYEHTRNIFRVTERITEQFASGRSSTTTRSLFGFLPRLKTQEERVDYFRIRDRQLFPQRQTDFVKIPGSDDAGLSSWRKSGSSDLSPELDDLLYPQSRRGDAAFRIRERPREMFKAIAFAQRRSWPRAADDAPGRFSRALHPGVRAAHLPGAARVFPSLHRGRTHAGLHRETGCRSGQTEDPKLADLPRALRKAGGSFRSLSRPCSCTIPARASARGRIPRPARFSRKAPRSVSSFRAEQRRSLILLVDHHLTLSNIGAAAKPR